jgi:FkbM family methyltransferase
MVTKHIESLMNRIKGFMFYYTLGERQTIFMLPDYESAEIVSPLFEYTNMKALYYIIKTKFKGIGVLIDIGAHIGKYSIIFAKLFPQLKVLAIEPSKLNFFFLLRNIRLNNIVNIVPINKAAYSYEGKQLLILSEYSGRHRVMSRINSARRLRVTTCEAVTIDKLVETYFPQVLRQKCREVPIIMKIDVEGAEPYVISGAALTISMCKNIVLLIEVEHQDVIKNLVSLGMKCTHLQEFLTRSNTNYVICAKFESKDR